jgi:predicted Zn-dependent peptidase
MPMLSQKYLPQRRLALLSNLLLLCSTVALGQTISTSGDRALTAISKLKNGIPIIARETPGSDIVHLEINFSTGTSKLPPERRALNLLALETMPFATKKFPKEKIFAMSEKFSFGVECKGGVETSHCQVETIRDYLPQALDLLTQVVLSPSFNQEDTDLAKKRRIADFQRETENPESRVNAVVNSIFYDRNHPFRLLPEDGINQTQSLTAEDLKNYHQTILDASTISIVYAGPKISNTTLQTLEKRLGSLGRVQRPEKPVPSPVFDPNNSFAFEHRSIPTAYIRLKFNAPSATSPDAEAADVMFEILSEKLQEEIRTKRSLSYAIHSGSIQYSQGIGMIAASTSKPRETLEAIANVVRNLREKGVTQEELNEYRNTFTTSYYLTMETHDSLAAALSTSHTYFNDAMRLYDMPAKLNAVTPADIQHVAKSTLTNMRGGIVFDKDKFMAPWFDPIKKL